MKQRCAHLERFYSLLDRLEETLGGARTPAECSGRMKWPPRGVYFFRETGEMRTDTGKGPRIVRVGTHALRAGSRTKLWGRLSQHKGLVSGSGNHRSSIFRLIVGNALCRRDGYDVPSWGLDITARQETSVTEIELEINVSRVLGRMPFLWIAISDEAGPESMRGVIERNSIALLSNYGKTPLDPPSGEWLGKYSDRERVRRSGLWNSNHVDEHYDPGFLDELEKLVSAPAST